MSPILRTSKYFLLVIAILLVNIAKAQIPAPITFGKIDIKDLEMKSYAKDTTAEAVVLCDYGEYSYFFGKDMPKVIYRRHVRIKILKKGGFAYASQRIPYYLSSDLDKAESIDHLEASTWNLENGSPVSYSLSDEDFFDEKGGNTLFYKKFTFPQVKEGSVLEYTYELESGLWYSLRTWNFQTSIPTIWSELRSEIPGYFDFKITFTSQNPLKIQENKQGTKNFLRGSIRDPYLAYRFAVENTPALKEEPFLTTLDNYRSRLSFELAATFLPNQGQIDYSQTWEKLNETLLTSDYFGKQIKRYDQAQKIAKQLIAQNKDSLSLLTAAYQYIQNNMKWDGENEVFTTNAGLNKVAEKGIGNAAEINLMLVRLLRECGFDANPLILSTRENGLPTDLVLLDRFDFTIAHVKLNGKDILLDATSKYAEVEMLPLRCLNERGRLIVRKDSRWIPIPSNITSRKTVLLEMSILPEQQVKGNINVTHSGHEAIFFRSTVLNNGTKEFINNLKKSKPSQTIEKVDLIAIDSVGRMPGLNLQTVYNEAYSIAGDRIYFSPMLDLGVQNNLFKSPIRNYPVEFGVPQEETFSAIYKIPADYVVEEIPKIESVNLPNGGGRYNFQVTILEGAIKVDSKISLKKAMYSKEEYGALRELYNRVVAKHAEKVILKKK